MTGNLSNPIMSGPTLDQQQAPERAAPALPDAAPVAEQQPAKPEAISNKLGVEEALVHRRSLLTALNLMREGSRTDDTDVALHMLLCSLQYRQVDEELLRETRLVDVVTALVQHPYRPAADLAVGLLMVPVWAAFARKTTVHLL